jgi:hypothetical protein
MKFIPLDLRVAPAARALQLRQILGPQIKPLILRHSACCTPRRQPPDMKTAPVTFYS